MIAQSVFWSSIAFILYAYFGYPLLLLALSLFRSRPVKKGDITPSVSFIVTAYNEEDRIKAKIENTFEQDYPEDKLEIIVASDCSTDRTDEIVKSFRHRGVRLVRAAERKGKENAQKHAVDAASGEILVFSDAAAILQPDGISKVVKNFNDPTVGCVSSTDKFIDRDGKLSGEGAYVRYEMFLRSLESRVNTLVGLSGSFFAARKEVCRNWAADLQSDFNTLLNSVKSGLRGVSDTESVGFYKNILHEQKEFDRKVRTVVRGISVFMRSLPLLNIFKYGLLSWQLASHKLCRWLVPFTMILAFVSNALIITYSTFYLYAFILQAAFYTIAFGGAWTDIFSKRNILKIPSFFVLVNLSILNAWLRYAKGDRMVSWTPSKR
ncbi:MAG: glycosyltransferase family 2 protein [Nitrospirae bacterium]|nr:glycosyltransferase family 2 protein [Nitrospirota bacterium]MCL5237682.1 glycosyltransferase family 2 protein [Nitrospirota bacterium]